MGTPKKDPPSALDVRRYLTKVAALREVALSEGARKDLPPSLPYPRLARPVCVLFEGRAVA